MSRPTLQAVRGRSSNMCWGRKDEEYIVDFLNIAKRTLSEPEHQVFRFHFLLGADWKMCCRRLGIDRGTFFHTVYRLQQHLGRALAETKPYALFPLDEYFNGSTRLEVHSAADITPVVRKGAKPRIDVPVRLAA